MVSLPSVWVKEFCKLSFKSISDITVSVLDSNGSILFETESFVEACSIVLVLIMSVSVVVTGAVGETILSIVSVRGSTRLLIAGIESISS